MAREAALAKAVRPPYGCACQTKGLDLGGGDGGGLEQMRIAGSTVVGMVGGSTPGREAGLVYLEVARRDRCGVPEDLEDLIVGDGRRHDCVCDSVRPAAGHAGRRHRKRKATGVTWRDGEGGADATDGVVDVPRCLCERDDGRQHTEVFEMGVAAAGGSNLWA